MVDPYVDDSHISILARDDWTAGYLIGFRARGLVVIKGENDVITMGCVTDVAQGGRRLVVAVSRHTNLTRQKACWIRCQVAWRTALP